MTEQGITYETLSEVWTRTGSLKPVKGDGIWLFDEEGNRYMDFTSGIGVVNTGHCHPKVVKAVQEQASHLLFAQMNCVVNPVTGRLTRALCEQMPSHLNKVFISNSGAEATEAAVKLARSATGRQNIIVFQGSFHGRTHLSMAMTTSKTIYRQHYQPLPSGIFVAPFPYAFQYGWEEEETVDFCIKQLDLLLHAQTAPSETAAIIIEPVLGEGGYVPVPARFLKHLREICTAHGILLIIDEVQSGFARTGTLFRFQALEVLPDILVMAKGLGSGLPISAIAASEGIMNSWTPGSHGGTYGGGSCIASAAALATLQVISDENLADNARNRGLELSQYLKSLQDCHDCIGDVRGPGLMIATEFVDENGDPNPKIAQAIIQGCMEEQLMLLGCGTYKNVIRWIPPLVVSSEEIREAVSIFEKVLRKEIQKKK